MMIKQVWTFPSDSNPSRTYETLQYIDGTTSCNCRGWTFKKIGQERSCKHTRLIDQGLADSQCLSTKKYNVLDPINAFDSIASTKQSKHSETAWDRRLSAGQKIVLKKPPKDPEDPKIITRPIPMGRNRKIELW